MHISRRRFSALWPPDSFDQVTDAAGQTQPKLELMMAWDADYFPSHTKSHWDIGQVVHGMSDMQDGDPRYMPLRWNSSVKCLRLGEDGLEIPIKWRSETEVKMSKNGAGVVESGKITREDYATDWFDAAAFPKVTSKVLFTQMLAWPNTMQKTLKARHTYTPIAPANAESITTYQIRLNRAISSENPDTPTTEEIMNCIIACPYEIFGNIDYKAAR